MKPSEFARIDRETRQVYTAAYCQFHGWALKAVQPIEPGRKAHRLLGDYPTLAAILAAIAEQRLSGEIQIRANVTGPGAYEYTGPQPPEEDNWAHAGTLPCPHGIVALLRDGKVVEPTLEALNPGVSRAELIRALGCGLEDYWLYPERGR